MTRERRLNCFFNLKKQHTIFALAFFDGVDSVYVPQTIHNDGDDDDKIINEFSSDYHENSQHITVIGRRERIIDIRNVELLVQILNKALQSNKTPENGFIQFPGDWFIDRSLRMYDLGEGLAQYSVVYSNIVSYHQNLFHVLDVKNDYFPVSQNLVDLFELTFRKSLTNYFLEENASERIKFEKMVRYYQVKFRDHQFPINSISNRNVNSVKFGKDQTMINYYKEVWNLDVDGRYPCIVSEYKNTTTYIPIDHCRLVFNMNFRTKLSYEQKRKIKLLRNSNKHFIFEYRKKINEQINFQRLFGIKLNVVKCQKFIGDENIWNFHKIIYLEKKRNKRVIEFVGHVLPVINGKLCENEYKGSTNANLDQLLLDIVRKYPNQSLCVLIAGGIDGITNERYNDLVEKLNISPNNYAIVKVDKMNHLKLFGFSKKKLVGNIIEEKIVDDNEFVLMGKKIPVIFEMQEPTNFTLTTPYVKQIKTISYQMMRLIQSN
ncbi:hypothetical protein SNEBB_006982 [Seison nebaliae]|nr:hypothetical protein SNEBB_006982 [Seison nebaliae]